MGGVAVGGRGEGRPGRGVGRLGSLADFRRTDGPGWGGVVGVGVGVWCRGDVLRWTGGVGVVDGADR